MLLKLKKVKCQSMEREHHMTSEQMGLISRFVSNIDMRNLYISVELLCGHIVKSTIQKNGIDLNRYDFTSRTIFIAIVVSVWCWSEHNRTLPLASLPG